MGFVRLLASTVCACLALYGQATTAIISGNVSDASGAFIPAARVTATNLDTNIAREAVTGSGGEFSIRFLPIGSYRVEINASGFKRFVQSPLVLDLNRDARINAVMELGALSESVSVTTDAPQVNTTDSSIGRTVDNAEIVTLPLVNRSVYSLLNLTPGVDSTETQNTLGMPEQHTLINGSNDGTVGSVAYYLDGGVNSTGLRNTGNTTPNPDAIEQFRVITNGYGAEFGRFTAGVVDVVTRSGSNAFHGSLFEFLRNDKLNAYKWGALSKSPLRRNQFGGSFGGPIIHNKTFFFGSYSGLRERQQVFKNAAIVPTALERIGNFSASKVIPVDPDTKAAFSGGLIPPSKLDSTAHNIIEQNIPLANLPGSFYQSQQPNPNDTNEFIGKVDHSFNTAHMLTLSYYTTKGKLTTPFIGNGNVPWSDQSFDWQQHNANINETWIINPSVINQFHVTYLRNFGGRLNSPAKSLADYGSKFRVQGAPSLPQITVTGYFTLSEAIDGPVAGSNFYGLRNILSITRGRHSMKMGVEASLEKFVHDTLLNNYGVFSFDGGRSNNALADFVMGLPRTMNQDAPVTKIDNGWYTGLFFQDDFRVHPRLTLNLGLRYEIQPPTTDPHDRKLTFVPGLRSQVVPSAIPGLLFPGDPGIGRGVVPTDKNNFAPRFGLAWDPFGDGKTSIRAGAGIFYGSISGNEWNSTNDRQPFAVRQQFNNVKSLTDPYALLPGGVSPFPYSYDPKNPRFITPAAVGGPALDYVWPYSYQFNFSVQRSIRDLTITTAYVGNMAHHLPFTVDANYPFYGPGATSGNVDQRRPFQTGQLSQILIIRSIMNTSYHGLQISADKRMSRNFTFKGFYTFSKGLEGAQLQNNSTDGGSQDARNLALERGRSSNDRKHNAVFSAIWDINYFGRLPVVPRTILGGWTISAIASFRSGTPFNVTSGRDNNLDGVNNDRPNLIGNPFLDPNRSRSDVTNAWFNTAAFQQNLAGQVGNFGRDVLNSPGQRNVDIGLFRQFRIRERMNLQFRAEMTNALNLVNLTSVNGTLNSLAFGTVRTARAMREMQLGLRLAF